MCKCPPNPPNPHIQESFIPNNQIQHSSIPNHLIQASSMPFRLDAKTGPYCNMCRDLLWVTPTNNNFCKVLDIWVWAEKQHQTVLEHLDDESKYFIINTPGYPRTYKNPGYDSNVFPIKQEKDGKYDKSIFNFTSPSYPADTQTSYNYKTWNISLPEGHEIGLTMLDCDLDPE